MTACRRSYVYRNAQLERRVIGIAGRIHDPHGAHDLPDDQQTIELTSVPLVGVAINAALAAVKIVAVDINPAVVTKLADRGTFQALGLVTDAELFMRELAEALGV